MTRSFLDFDDDDDDGEKEKFVPKHGLECEGCKNLRRPKICQKCDAGEYFEERDPDGLDFLFDI
jgi:hypothetical protein